MIVSAVLALLASTLGLQLGLSPAGAQDSTTPVDNATTTTSADPGTETTEPPLTTTVPEDTTTTTEPPPTTTEPEESTTTAEPGSTTAPATTVAESTETTAEPTTTPAVAAAAAEADPAAAAESELAPKAAGPPVYEIDGAWVNPPPNIARGEPVVGEWRVNVNDSGEPPSNDAVDNVTVTFNLGKAFFDELPDLCLTEGVDPPSSISPDGLSMTCNFGTVNMGTAIVVQTPVVADGITGEEVTHDGTIEGQTEVLPPIPIVSPFILDIQYGQNTTFGAWNDTFTLIDVDVQWTLRLGAGSDPGPDELTYRLDVAEVGGHAVNVGTHPRSGLVGCSPFDLGNADGHPWSRTDIPQEDPRNGRFVDECILTEPSPGVFALTLRGIDYSLLDIPTQDSSGLPLPPNWDAIASGSLWFRVITDEAGSINVQSNAPTYEAPTGQEFTDPAGNNTTNKSYTLPGSWSAWWQRSFTGSGGRPWDDAYRVSAGTLLMQRTHQRFSADNVPPGAPYGGCLIFDTEYLTLEDAPPNRPDDPVTVYAFNEAGQWHVPGSITREYYVGSHPLVTPGNPGYDPNAFNCSFDPGNWTTALPTDLATVRAARILYPHSTFAAEDAERFELRAFTRVNEDVEVGQDVWMFGTALRNGVTLGLGPPWDTTQIITPTPDARYDFTNGRRDIVRIIGALPFIEKESATATVTPGVPADFTLTYSAGGSGIIPPTVDDYQIIDTLPVGMTYEPGSADPEPVVTTSGGQQVLTWTFDDVATNVDHELTYQATVDSNVAPGTRMTNTAQSTYDGVSSEPVSETVTITTNGFTIILKTADVDYIPNETGDGVGTGSWTVLIDSSDPLPQAFTDTIDILPYNGDGRGTSFSGSYTLDEVVVPAGATVYYTGADPATLSDDPADPSNGAAGDPTGNDVGWTTTRPETVTAIRVIGGELPAGGEFSFQVVITTDGAQPQDVYVNRAQARAEHTSLVMRTSAALVVTDYTVMKVSNPPSGSTVSPESVVTYTVTVTQVGPVPAGALWTDTLTEVFDDAVYNDDVTADIGTATIDGDVLSWEGVVPVGGVATITYSVTVKDRETLAAEGDTVTTNVVTSPGCRMPEDCTTTVIEGWYDYSKTSDPVPGSDVVVGEEITYSVEITQHGEGAIAGAIAIDDLSAVLDDATWNNEIDASIGSASLDGTTLTWTGDLEPGDVAELTYSVTVTEGGDSELENVVTSPDTERSQCVPAPDENPDCTTDHQLIGSFIFAKTSNPAPGTTVRRGDVVTYTVMIEQVGPARVEDASIRDDLAAVLADATWNGDARATSGSVAFAGTSLTWTGDLEVDQIVTLTYSVTVAETDARLRNVVTSDDPRGACAGPGDASSTSGRAVRQIAATGCVTEHLPPTASPSAITPKPVAVTG